MLLIGEGGQGKAYWRSFLLSSGAFTRALLGRGVLELIAEAVEGRVMHTRRLR